MVSGHEFKVRPDIVVFIFSSATFQLHVQSRERSEFNQVWLLPSKSEDVRRATSSKHMQGNDYND